MDRDYDIFEVLADDSPVWRGRASGLREVRLKLQEFANATDRECFAIHLPTKEIVARLNIGGRTARKPTIFQIAYDHRLSLARTDVLRRHGHEVVSVIGNEAAKVVLTLPQHCDLFLVGHGAPEESRCEMAVWLKSRFPGVPIVALNSPEIRELPGADYNVKINGPETWLPKIATALNASHWSGAPPAC